MGGLSGTVHMITTKIWPSHSGSSDDWDHEANADGWWNPADEGIYLTGWVTQWFTDDYNQTHHNDSTDYYNFDHTPGYFTPEWENPKKKNCSTSAWGWFGVFGTGSGCDEPESPDADKEDDDGSKW